MNQVLRDLDVGIESGVSWSVGVGGRGAGTRARACVMWRGGARRVSEACCYAVLLATQRAMLSYGRWSTFY